MVRLDRSCETAGTTQPSPPGPARLWVIPPGSLGAASATDAESDSKHTTEGGWEVLLSPARCLCCSGRAFLSAAPRVIRGKSCAPAWIWAFGPAGGRLARADGVSAGWVLPSALLLHKLCFGHTWGRGQATALVAVVTVSPEGGWAASCARGSLGKIPSLEGRKEHWNRLPGAVLEPPFLWAFNSRGDVAPGDVD